MRYAKGVEVIIAVFQHISKLQGTRNAEELNVLNLYYYILIVIQRLYTVPKRLKKVRRQEEMSSTCLVIAVEVPQRIFPLFVAFEVAIG